MSSTYPDIQSALRARVPYKDIQAMFGVSSKTVAKVAKETNIVQRHRGMGAAIESNGKQGESGKVSSVPDTKTTEYLHFLNDFFKANANWLFESKGIRDYIKANAEKFNEVEALCQA